MEEKKINETPTCDKLKEINAGVLLRVMSSPKWTRDLNNRPMLKDINRAREKITHQRFIFI